MTSVETASRTPRSGAPLRVAVIHDFLVSRGGAERVALSMARAFPEATVHTALHDPEATFDGFADHEIRPLMIDHLPGLRRYHRASLPLLQIAFSRRVVDADVVVCSTSGFAHNVRTTGSKLVYCHTPARWLHDRDRYLDRFGTAARIAAGVLTKVSHQRDVQAMASADRILVNSRVIREQIHNAYARDAEVLAPCSSLALPGALEALPGVEPGFVFCPSRAIGYKRLDVLVQAARALPHHQFVQVGEGPDLPRLRSDAPSNLHFFGSVSDAAVRWGYSNAALVALTSAEDFGLVPLEARAHGLMSVVPRARGFLDHVTDGINGWFYSFGEGQELAATIEAKIAIRATVPATDPLGEQRFIEALRRIVAEVGAQ